MSRNLVYVNGQNESVTFETSPYLIVKIEGLGIPNVDRQEQKAPYQDGTTYIDSLLQNRDIVVELAITKPNDFANIALYRRELSQRLCPKYGLGTLTYTDEDDNAYNIRAVVSSMVFPNKDYRDPYMRAMITFTACDPYWMDVTTDSISLPTSVTSSESVINGSNSYTPFTIQLSDGSLFIAYTRASDQYLVSRIYTTSWSGESVINAAISYYPSVIQLPDDSIFVAYIRFSDEYLVSRTYTTSWSAESVINNAISTAPSSIQLLNGNLFIAYVRFLDGYLVSRTYTTSWSAESIINAASSEFPSVIQFVDGSLFIAYRRASDGYLVSKTYTTSWSWESVINAASSYTPFAIQLSDYILFIAYRRSADEYLVSRTYTTSWSGESIINAASSTNPSVIKLSDNSLFIAYKNSSTSYLVSVTRSVTPVPAVITGDVPAPFLVTFNGPSVNPRIINQNTLEYIRLNTTLAAADHFDVDTSFGNKTVILTQGGIVRNGIAFLDIGSTFFQLARPTLPSLPIGVNPYRGLKAYWSFDSFTGSTALPDATPIPDDSGNGNIGLAYGGCTPVDGISGKALAFDGVNDYCETTTQITTPAAGFTMSAWFKASVLTAATSYNIMSMYYPYISIYDHGIDFGFRDSTDTTRSRNIQLELVENIWYQVTCTHDGTTAKIYLNGVLRYSNTLYNLGSRTSTVRISRYTTIPSQHFPGTIDEPRIYNRALSAEEVKYLYDNPGVPIPADATVVYYEDDAVLSTATATMEWTERFVGV